MTSVTGLDDHAEESDFILTMVRFLAEDQIWLVAVRLLVFGFSFWTIF